MSYLVSMDTQFSDLYKMLSKAICPAPVQVGAPIIKITSIRYCHRIDDLQIWPLDWQPPVHLRVPWYRYST